MARKRLEILQKVEVLRLNGIPIDIAAMQIGKAHEKGVSTIHSWRARVAGVEKVNWLPYLADSYTGRTATIECSPDAWDMLRSNYLRDGGLNFSECYRQTLRAAKDQGWNIPSERTLLRRLRATVHPAVIVACRNGAEALKRMYPAQERDRSGFAAMEAVNVDGHKWDVWVQFPDGEICRPMMVGFQDLYSGKILSWRIDKSENTWAVRLAFGDMLEAFGVPKRCYLDNGRAFASKWLTGGIPNRYRFKVKDDEPLGIMTQMGIDLHWTTPYAGQSKPIERTWRDLAQNIARHPAFDGAWTGNTVVNKPDSYRSRAIPLDHFMEVLSSEIAEHNARPGRNTRVCNKVLSFDDAFEASVERYGLTKCPEEARRLWMLAANGIMVSNLDGVVKLMGNRYWSEWLHMYRGEKIVARFDPEFLHDGLHIYKMDGAYLGFADCIAAVGFADADAAREHGRARKQWLKAVHKMRDAERRMSPAAVAALIPTSTAAPVPDSTILKLPPRPVHELKQRPSSELTDAQKARRASLSAEIAAFPTQQPSEQDKKRQRFAQALEIQRALSSNGAVGDGNAAWLARYQATAEYKALAALAAEFGGAETA